MKRILLTYLICATIMVGGSYLVGLTSIGSILVSLFVAGCIVFADEMRRKIPERRERIRKERAERQWLDDNPV